MFLALPKEDDPLTEAKIDWISLVTLWSTAEPIRGPAVLVCALYPAFVWMSDRTVLASLTSVFTAVDAADASGATVTVTGDVEVVRRSTLRPGRRPVTVLVWDWKAYPPAPPTRISALRPAAATLSAPRDEEAKALVSTDSAEAVPVVDDESS